MKKSDKNKKTNKKESKQKQSEESQFSGMTFALGELDLIFDIIFEDKDLENPKSQSEDDKYIKIEELKTIKDLSFLIPEENNEKTNEQKEKEKKFEDFLNRIKLRPNNEFIKQLLLGNKISKKKCFIDFICYGRPKFEGDTDFFNRIFNYVTVNNGLQINDTPLEEGSRYSIIINLRHRKHPEQVSVIEEGTTPSKEKEGKEKEEASKKEEEEKKKKEKEDEEKKEKEELKNKKIQEYKEQREKEKKEKEKKGNKSEEGEGEGEGKKEEEEQKDEEKKEEVNEGENNNEVKNEEKNGEKKEEEKEENKKEKEDEEEQEDYEETDAMKEKKIPKFRRNNVLCKLNPSCTKYDLVFLNYEEISKIPGDFKIKYLVELLAHFKKKKSNIFINFYKNEPSQEEKDKEESKKKETEKNEEKKRDEESQKEEEEKKKREENLKKIYEEKKELMKKQKDLTENKKKEKKEISDPQKDDELIKINKELEKKDEEMNDIFDEMRAEEEVKKEFQKRKEKEKKKEEKEKDEKEKKEMREMNEIFFLTDGYFFDTKQACEIFNKHYLSHTTDKIKNRKQINKQKVFDYFITSIATGTLDEVQGKKVGLFMEDLNRYNIIYCSKKAASKKELNAQPHPKINPHNTKLVEEYQKIIKKNKNDYYSVFVSLAAHEISACHNISLEAVYPTFLIGLEIIKRKVECQKNNITSINEEQLYRVKINEKALQQELEKIASDTKEGGFILDCTNKSKSTLKDYVALYDYHLKGFFSSELIRNYLKTKNFINAEGYIMYDPVYRNVMGAECKNKKKYEGDELKAKIITGIKGIDVPARIKDKELEVKKAVEKQNDHIGKKIPFSKEINQYNQTKKKRKKKKKEGSEEGNSSSGGSQSEGEGSSGDEQNEPKKEENPVTPNQ